MIIKKLCIVETCDQPFIAKGFCTKHYARWRTNGDPNIVGAKFGRGETFEEKFWSRVDIRSEEECWEWQGTKHHTGYGIARYNNGYTSTHRVAWILHNQKTPTKFILHSCDNRICVNPNHLREGTHKENSQDAVERDRFPKGSNVYCSKLIEADVILIKQEFRNGTLLVKEAAKRLGVAENTIRRIIQGKKWKHLKI